MKKVEVLNYVLKTFLNGLITVFKRSLITKNYDYLNFYNRIDNENHF